jgi:anti-anti-sigma factor
MFAGAGQPAAEPVNAPVRRGVSSGIQRLDVSIEKAGSNIRLCLCGTLDSASAASAYDLIVASAVVPTRQLHLDLNGLDAATRAGCRAIHVAAKLLHSRSGRMSIFGAKPNVEAVLKNTGFDNLIQFQDGEAPSAVAASTLDASSPNRLRDVA